MIKSNPSPESGAKSLTCQVVLEGSSLEKLKKIEEHIAKQSGFAPRKYQLYSMIFIAGMKAIENKYNLK